jgi:hypothetical protein
LPGKRPAEAFHAFVEPLQDALSCLAQAKVTVSAGGVNVAGRVHALTVNNDQSIRLKAKPLLLRVRMQYEIIQDDRPDYGPWRVTTRGYSHEVQLTSGEAVVSWHWHPDSTVQEPHIHNGSTQLAADAVLSRRHHIPTDRVSLESVVRFCLDDLGVEPLRDNWDEVLTLRESMFKLHRSWASYPQTVEE